MAVDDVLDKLVGHTIASNLTYMGISNYGHLQAKQVTKAPPPLYPARMPHSCFLPAVSMASHDGTRAAVRRWC